MIFEFRGILCGFLCTDCREELAGVKVRLYRNRKDQNLTGLSVANPKDTIAILDEESVRAKTSSLIAETETGSDGSFNFQLGPEQKYEGGAFEVDVYCATVPHLKPSKASSKPLQFSITTLQPMWKQTDRGALAFWQYCIPSRFWCDIRRRFGAWTICGHVRDCRRQDRLPVAGITVSAFDVDWIQDDALGSAITDSSGHFRIDYLAADFKRTPFPWLNVELFGGPDLYFKVESPGGGLILDEPPSRGRDHDRENAGPCFCVDLCVDQPGGTRHAWFTHVGDFAIITDIDPATGKTNTAAPVGLLGAHGGSGFGFYDGLNQCLKLIGDCSATHPSGGDPMRYRFLYEHPATPGILNPITGAAVRPQLIGTRPIPWRDASGSITTFQSIWVAGSGGTTSPPPLPVPPVVGPWVGPPAAVIVPDVNGWVIVDPLITNGAISGPLIGFISATAVPGGSPLAPGDSAGNAPVNQKNGVGIRIVFQAEPVGGATLASPTLSNELTKILINNWAGVNELDLLQFTLPGSNCCTPLLNQLGIMYTTDHELMRSWSIAISSCASGLGWSPTPPPLPSGPTVLAPRGDHGTDNVNITSWPGCSYLISLGTVRALTDGENDDPGTSTLKTFCIDR